VLDNQRAWLPGALDQNPPRLHSDQRPALVSVTTKPFAVENTRFGCQCRELVFCHSSSAFYFKLCQRRSKIQNLSLSLSLSLSLFHPSKPQPPSKPKTNPQNITRETCTVGNFVDWGSLQPQRVPDQVPNVCPSIRVPLHHAHTWQNPTRPLVLSPPLVGLNHLLGDSSVGGLSC
jgi:hypothetical protein